jgi:digeranylgeranylglycerophospholipid reductase
MPEKGNVFDIAVVGAGPAGAMAARSAAEAGKSVCLIDRKKNPGAPVRCGEGIGLKGMSMSIDLDPAWPLTRIHHVRMYSPSNIQVEMHAIDESCILDRERMDADLVKNAQCAGATLMVETPIVAVERNGRGMYLCHSRKATIECRCLIIADGVESRLARDLGWNTALSMDDINTCAFCRVEHPDIAPDWVHFYVGSGVAPGGYAWIFPRGRGAANVGLGILGPFSGAGKARELLNAFVEKKMPGGKTSHMHSGGVPVAPWLRPLVRDGAMVVGDAARQVSALTGAGIAYSLWAGKMAGKTAAEAICGDHIDYSTLKNYENEWARYFGKQQKRSYTLKTTLLRHFNDKDFDAVAAALKKQDSRKLSYLRLFSTVFARRPSVLMKVFFLFRR